MHTKTEFKITSLSYDVHSKRLFCIINSNLNGFNCSVNINFPFQSFSSNSDDELRLQMEERVRSMLHEAAGFK